MSSWAIEFAQRQSTDEVERQYRIANRMEMRRRFLALVPFTVACVFVNPLVCILLAICSSVLEIVGLRMIKGLVPARQPVRYLLALISFFVANALYMLVAVLVWNVDDPYAKSFAVGAILANVVHVATIRTVHIPIALMDFVAAVLVVLLGNAQYWGARGDHAGLAVSMLCLLAAIYFSYFTMRAVHEMHAETNREQKAALMASEAKSRFLAQMSHELRTPLNAIIGMGYAELTQASTDEGRERLSTLVRSARSLTVLVNDILDLTAVEAGQLLIRPKVVNLRSEIESAVDLFRQQITESRLELNLHVSADLPVVAKIDEQRFRQCMSNILSNAVKYTPKGRIRIAVTPMAPNLMSIEVSDTGPGVSVEMRERIFEPFYRGESRVTGTGLGLSISRTLARRMGGDVVLMPSEVGARFQLSLAIPYADPAELPPPPTESLVNLKKCRVLVVDDTATNRLVALTYLRILGAEGQAAVSGAEALEMIAAAPPDVVLLDLVMDGMDGFETFFAIRELGEIGRSLPVIAMTADVSDESRRNCLTVGMNGYVSKPMSAETLGAAIQAVLPG